MTYYIYQEVVCTKRFCTLSRDNKNCIFLDDTFLYCDCSKFKCRLDIFKGRPLRCNACHEMEIKDSVWDGES